MAFRTNKMPILQEKSASGAVATFNTALAMPLASCNIAVNAWQEGSGDPSPSNVRAIHGFSEVNATRAGKNLFDINNPLYTANSISYLTNWCSKVENGILYNGGKRGTNSGGGITIPAKAGVSYTISCNCGGETNIACSIRFVTIGADNVWTSNYNAGAVAPVDGKINATVTMREGFTHIYFGFFSDTQYGSWETDIQIEAGSEATAYEPYVTPTIYTIQLGQEVFGGVYDAVSGKFVATHRIDRISDYTEWSQQSLDARGYQFYRTFSDMKQSSPRSVICSHLKSAITVSNYYSCWFGSGRVLAFTLDNNSTLTDWINFLTNNDVYVCYTLATPFDIQLTPQQIETLIGNNTIFADTGDVDLTYKDLDIAKRGNFREVFRLPS